MHFQCGWEDARNLGSREGRQELPPSAARLGSPGRRHVGQGWQLLVSPTQNGLLFMACSSVFICFLAFFFIIFLRANRSISSEQYVSYSPSSSPSISTGTASYTSSQSSLNSLSLLLSSHLQFLLYPNLSPTRPFVFFKHKWGFKGSHCAYRKESRLFSPVQETDYYVAPKISPQYTLCVSHVKLLLLPCAISSIHFLSDCFSDKALRPFSFQPTSAHLKEEFNNLLFIAYFCMFP